MDRETDPLLPEDPLFEQQQQPPAPSSPTRSRHGSHPSDAAYSPPRRRRNTFTRPSFSASSGSPRIPSAGNLTAPPGTVYSHDTHAAFANDDLLETSRANSLTSAGGFRDLRSYDMRGQGPNRRNSITRRLSSTGDNPVLAQNSSPSFAERWVTRQSMLQNSMHPRYGSTSRGGETVVNMDEFERQNRPRSKSSHSDTEDLDSKPSTRRNSDASSLNDVCFPLDNIDDIQGMKNWPDLSVLEEFRKEEMEKLQDEAQRETEAANLRFDQFSDSTSFDGQSGQVGFSHPIVTKVDTSASISQPPALSQQLFNQKINETETLSGRLRPPKINPFDKSHNKYKPNAKFLNTITYPQHIISGNPDHFRFTYFREDLDSTVHSPTISGLLQPGQKFADLFDWREYTRESLLQQQQQQQPSQHSSTPNLAIPTSASTPVRDFTPAASETKASSITEDTSPFWLDVLNPTEEEMKVISKTFQIHPLTTEDIFLGETREKVELFKDYYFVCFRSFDINEARKKKKNRRKSQLSDDVSSIKQTLWSRLIHGQNAHSAKSTASFASETTSKKRRRKQLEREKYQRKSGEKHMPKNDELEPLNVYIIVFRHAVITFHFAPTPHLINVRRRARLLREYLTVSADWIAYALIDDITDAFGPMIESIEDDVNDIEDAILRMHPGNDSSDESSSDSDEEYDTLDQRSMSKNRKYSTVEGRSVKSMSSASTRSTASNVIEWKKKGDLLKRIAESRKRVMSLLRLLGSKVDVIKGFAKRCNEQWEVAPRSEIGMYLGDIQDHIVTMVQSLNHYEKLLARSHSNYLAQINIDMTKVNNDTNDVLGKISILGTVVLPMNIVTGMWGMNVIVPGQDYDGLTWFWGIVLGMFMFAACCYIYMKRISGLT